MNPAELRACLASVVGGTEVVYGEEIVGTLEKPPVPAAVLVPIVMHAEPSLLLTKRTSHLKNHAGQVSFPGGRIDPEDASPEAAALREAAEEIALDPSRVEIVGRMNEYVTGTGYIITPVLRAVAPWAAISAVPIEVEAVFEFPFSTLLNPAAPRRQKQHVRGQWRRILGLAASGVYSSGARQRPSCTTWPGSCGALRRGSHARGAVRGVRGVAIAGAHRGPAARAGDRRRRAPRRR